MRHHKVSILIPVYNREKFIGACIQSALDQTYSNFEVVVVDNASTDTTWDICQKFSVQDKRVRIFQNRENIGPVKNWKRCFDEAKGEFGKILFSDDLLLPDCLEKSVAMMSENVAFVFSPVLIGTGLEDSNVGHVWRKHSGYFSVKSFIDDAVWRNCGGVPMSPGAALFRLDDMQKNLILEIESSKYNDFSSHGAGPDFLIYLLTAEKYDTVAFFNESLSFFRVHSDSITTKNSKMVAVRYEVARFFFSKDIVEDEDLLRKMLLTAWLRALKSNYSISFNFFCWNSFLYQTSFLWSDIYSVLSIMWSKFRG